MTLKNNNSIENKLNQPLFSLSPNATVKISLWHLISDPFKLLIQNWQNLFLFGIPIALILSFSSIMFKHPFVCLTDKESSLTSPLCSDDFEYYYINLLIRIILIMFFATKWFHFSILKNTFSLKNIFLLHKGDFKGIGTIILFVSMLTHLSS